MCSSLIDVAIPPGGRSRVIHGMSQNSKGSDLYRIQIRLCALRHLYKCYSPTLLGICKFKLHDVEGLIPPTALGC
jgi:hypothetical protein